MVATLELWTQAFFFFFFHLLSSSPFLMGHNFHRVVEISECEPGKIPGMKRGKKCWDGVFLCPTILLCDCRIVFTHSKLCLAGKLPLIRNLCVNFLRLLISMQFLFLHL